MTLIAGLGNIGKEYELTRHNAGFMLADMLLARGGFTDVSSAKFKGELYKKGSLLILKPSTFMNASGLAVKAVCDFYKPERLIVVHDDVDLKLGALKFKRGGGNAGHNGLKSIDALMGADYERVRIGIGNDKKDVVAHVLGRFDDEERETLLLVLERAMEATLELVATDDIKAVAAKYSQKAPDLGPNIKKDDSNLN